jgi:competence protein ComGC
MLKGQPKGIKSIELVVMVLVLVAVALITVPSISRSASNVRVKACNTNIDVINSVIEQYYVDNERWPAVLTDVTQNKSYFFKGEPTCSVTNKTYPNKITADHRLDDSKHKH